MTTDTRSIAGTAQTGISGHVGEKVVVQRAGADPAAGTRRVGQRREQ